MKSILGVACAVACAAESQVGRPADRGFAELKARTAGHVACPAEELRIPDLPPHGQRVLSWTVECRGHVFVCSGDDRVDCHELPAPREWSGRKRAADSIEAP